MEEGMKKRLDVVIRRKRFEEKKNEWKYVECPCCFIMYPHLTVPQVCACGNDMGNNNNQKTLKLIKCVLSEKHDA